VQRRDFLKGVAVTVTAATSEWEARSDAAEGGPFALPTAKFNPGAQHELPPWAFQTVLPPSPVPLPTKIGRFEEVDRQPVFGPLDTVPLSGAFHGIAREWSETPSHWKAYGCNPTLTGKRAWDDKQAHFGRIRLYGLDGRQSKTRRNWAAYQIKCYRLPIMEQQQKLREDVAFPARLYTYGGVVPGPTFKFRLGEPCVVRYENQLETEVSVHHHGGHSPAHSDGFPTFYVLQGKTRDYFYPNIVPLYRTSEGPTPQQQTTRYLPDEGESQSTTWYHDHAMDATAYNVSKGLAGFALCFGDEELQLIAERVLPGYGPRSCEDPTCVPYDRESPDLKPFEDPELPGFYRHDKQPYYNPFDIPLVLQDKVIDRQTGQISYDLTDHNGYLGDTHFVNGIAWPQLPVRNRKYRLRVLDGSNARVYRLRIMTAENYAKAVRFGIDDLDPSNQGEPARKPLSPAREAESAQADAGSAASWICRKQSLYDKFSEPFLRIGKDSWLWSAAVEMKSVVLTMANRADLVVDFGALTRGLQPGEEREFILVNTMPQFDGRGPKGKLDDGGDPRVLPIPFDLPGRSIVELNRPIGLLKFVVRYEPPGSPNDPPGDQEASVQDKTPLILTHRRILDTEILAVREFIFQRGKGAWQINGRFYDPYLAHAAPLVDGAEEWVFRNGGGGWWHPIHVHLEGHQLVRYEKDFLADDVIDLNDPPAQDPLTNTTDLFSELPKSEAYGVHDTMALGPNTVARIRIRQRTFAGPFVFHCHNLEHEDMRMMFNFETVPPVHDPNVAPDARTHGNDVTLGGKIDQYDRAVGELPWEQYPVPRTPVRDAGEPQIPARPRPATDE
jgi:FtsP/CotA-like multicopper oxidase with cupredoxin domain